MAHSLVIRGGSVVTTDGPVRADVAVEGESIVTVGTVGIEPDERVVDATGRLVMPGFVDAHSHADGLLADPEVQQALLRQGVTSVVVGQDGVSYAPGSGAYASEYFAAINGPHPTYRGGGVAAYLTACDGTSAVNTGYLIPAGTVRHEVCGRSQDPANAEQRQRMSRLVTAGLAEGALGLSTGLDYVPGLFQTTDEIAELCRPVARAGGIYVSHMRGGYEANAAAGIKEIARIASAVRSDGPLPVHVSHFHADADTVLAQLEPLQDNGIDATFDAYPYVRSCSLLGMPLLPPELSVRPVAEAVRVISDPASRPGLKAACEARVLASASLGPRWTDQITLAHVPARDYAWAQGLTLADAGRRAGLDPMDLALDVLAAGRLEVSAVMAVPTPRPDTELALIFAHPAHVGGSDGIFIGTHPHPRAFGTFAQYLRVHVRELGTWSWADAMHHLSALPARRFRLGHRGVVAPGAVADLVLVDPDTVTDRATYDDPRQLAVGIDDVLVSGVPVLSGGALTGAQPGRGLRRDHTSSPLPKGH